MLKVSCVVWIRLAEVAITGEAQHASDRVVDAITQRSQGTVMAVSHAVTSIKLSHNYRGKKAYIFQCEIIGN